MTIATMVTMQVPLMAWIKEIPEADWSGELKTLRPHLQDPKTKHVDHILSVHSLDADSLKAHLAVYRQAMKPTATLPKVDREMIAVVVSKQNGCHY